MRRKLLGTLTIAAFVVSACGSQKEPPRRATVQALASAAVAEMRPDSGVVGGVGGVSRLAFQAAPGSPAPDRKSAQIPGERKLVRQGEMTIEVRSVTEALARLGQIIRSAAGHTANQSERQNEYGGRSASVTCRVPAERLDATVAAVKALGMQRTLTLTAEDITTAYFDVGVRIDTQSRLERQLVALLLRPTNKLSDLLEIERELARVREEIDRLEGRKRSWDSQIAQSSLVITLEEPPPVVAGTGGGLLRTLGQSFGEAAENFVLAVAGIIAAAGTMLPIVFLIGVGWVAVRRWWRRRAPVSPAV